MSFICFGIITCDDIFEEDISGDFIKVVYPIENEIVEGNSVKFEWNDIDGADGFNIQIKNNDTQVNIIDSLVSKTQVTFNIPLGEYQWQVRGENSAYASSYSYPEVFKVIVTDDLSNQVLELKNPKDNVYLNNFDILFTWLSINSVDSYVFEIIDSSEDMLIYTKADITKNNYLATSEDISNMEGVYKWQVKAVNNISESAFTTRTISFDKTSPKSPLLSVPENNLSLKNKTVNFEWTTGIDEGVVVNEVLDLLEISADINFAELVFSNETAKSPMKYEFSNSGSYYWRVKSTDQADNSSPYSAARKISIE